MSLLDHLDTVAPLFDQDEREVGVIVWENILAARGLSAELFRGPFDECWTLRDSGPCLSYRGSELDKLKGESRTDLSQP
jgi:hypothetical protein